MIYSSRNYILPLIIWLRAVCARNWMRSFTGAPATPPIPSNPALLRLTSESVHRRRRGDVNKRDRRGLFWAHHSSRSARIMFMVHPKRRGFTPARDKIGRLQLYFRHVQLQMRQLRNCGDKSRGRAFFKSWGNRRQRGYYLSLHYLYYPIKLPLCRVSSAREALPAKRVQWGNWRW